MVNVLIPQQGCRQRAVKPFFRALGNDGFGADFGPFPRRPVKARYPPSPVLRQFRLGHERMVLGLFLLVQTWVSVMTGKFQVRQGRRSALHFRLFGLCEYL